MTYKISDLLSDTREYALPLQEEDTVSWERVQELTLDKIHREQPESQRPKRRVRRVAVLAAAALLTVCLTVTAAASGALSSVGGLFSAWFGGEPGQIELIERLGQPLGVSESRNGITISADAILSDGENFVILYTASRDDGTPLIPADAKPGGKLHFGFTGGDGGTVEQPVGWNPTSIHRFIDGAPGDSAAHYLESYKAPNGMPEENLFCFSNLGYWTEDDAGNTVILKLHEMTGDPGTNDDVWQLEIPLPSGVQKAEIIPVNNEIFSANGEEFVVTGLTVSPLAVTVNYEVTSTTPSAYSDSEAYGDGRFTDNMSLVLRKKDGTEIDLSTYKDSFQKAHPAGQFSMDQENDKFLCSYGGVMPEIVSPEDMECVIFNGVEIPLS